jgi:hypothetical protein
LELCPSNLKKILRATEGFYSAVWPKYIFGIFGEKGEYEDIKASKTTVHPLTTPFDDNFKYLDPSLWSQVRRLEG